MADGIDEDGARAARMDEWITERFRKAKDEWHSDPTHHGAMETPRPPLKSPCWTGRGTPLAQIRTGHWRSAVYLKRIRKRADDKCWFCRDHDRVAHEMTRSHVLLNCRNPRLAAARAEALEGRNPGNVRRLLADPRWEKRFVCFLELSGVGRTMADGTDEEVAYAARMDTWIAWEAEEEAADGYPPRGDS
jgi:hypothetical protein